MAASPEKKDPPPLLARRWVRVATGLSLLGLCSALALGAWALPYVEILAGDRHLAVYGAAQTDNLHLVLVATGALGVLASLWYAGSSAPLRYTFLVLGAIALLFTGLIWLGAYHTVDQGLIADPEMYRKVRRGPVDFAVGSALWLSLIAGLGILALGVITWRAGAHAPSPESPGPRRL
jgi:hypothetical protein